MWLYTDVCICILDVYQMFMKLIEFSGVHTFTQSGHFLSANFCLHFIY